MHALVTLTVLDVSTAHARSVVLFRPLVSRYCNQFHDKVTEIEAVKKAGCYPQDAEPASNFRPLAHLCVAGATICQMPLVS